MDVGQVQQVVVRMRSATHRERRLGDPPRSDPETGARFREERELQQRAADGDQAAWGDLVESQVAAMWWLATLVTRDQVAAAAVCEVVWLRLAQALPLPASEPVRSWLGRAVWEEAGSTGTRTLAGRREVDADGGGRLLTLPRQHAVMR